MAEITKCTVVFVYVREFGGGDGVGQAEEDGEEYNNPSLVSMLDREISLEG